MSLRVFGIDAAAMTTLLAEVVMYWIFGTFKIPFVKCCIRIVFIICFGTLFNDVILESE